MRKGKRWVDRGDLAFSRRTSQSRQRLVRFRFARIANFVTRGFLLPTFIALILFIPAFAWRGCAAPRTRSVVPLFLQGNSTRDEEISRRQADLRGPYKIPRLNTARIRARSAAVKMFVRNAWNVRRKIPRDEYSTRDEVKGRKLHGTLGHASNSPFLAPRSVTYC